MYFTIAYLQIGTKHFVSRALCTKHEFNDII